MLIQCLRILLKFHEMSFIRIVQRCSWLDAFLVLQPTVMLAPTEAGTAQEVWKEY